MTRQPKARARILEAARAIVAESGAGALTYDELSRVSGVTRGGITYHFPTKDALLRGLLDHDMQQWKRCEAAATPCDADCSPQSELLAHIRSHTSQDEGRQRFYAGMLSAAVHQPELLESCRTEVRQRYAGLCWDEPTLRLHLLRLAASGLFWEELFDMHPVPPAARAELVALLERLAREWTVDPAGTETITRKTRD